MAKHRSRSIEFKRQAAQEFAGGETLHGLAKRPGLPRNLIRIWAGKYEEGAFDGDAHAAGLIQAYEARIAALERLAGKQALELEFLKGALKNAASGREAGLHPSSPARRHLRRQRMPADGDIVAHPENCDGKIKAAVTVQILSAAGALEGGIKSELWNAHSTAIAPF